MHWLDIYLCEANVYSRVSEKKNMERNEESKTRRKNSLFEEFSASMMECRWQSADQFKRSFCTYALIAINKNCDRLMAPDRLRSLASIFFPIPFFGEMITPHSCLRFQMSIHWVTPCQTIYDANLPLNHFPFLSLRSEHFELNSNDLFWDDDSLTILGSVWKKRTTRGKTATFLKKNFEPSFLDGNLLVTFSSFFPSFRERLLFNMHLLW